MHHQHKTSATPTDTYSFARLSNRELATTDTLDTAIAPPASAGDNNHPVYGYNSPAAMGMPNTL